MEEEVGKGEWVRGRRWGGRSGRAEGRSYEERKMKRRDVRLASAFAVMG